MSSREARSCDNDSSRNSRSISKKDVYGALSLWKDIYSPAQSSINGQSESNSSRQYRVCRHLKIHLQGKEDGKVRSFWGHESGLENVTNLVFHGCN